MSTCNNYSVYMPLLLGDIPSSIYKAQGSANCYASFECPIAYFCTVGKLRMLFTFF